MTLMYMVTTLNPKLPKPSSLGGCSVHGVEESVAVKVLRSKAGRRDAAGIVVFLGEGCRSLGFQFPEV